MLEQSIANFEEYWKFPTQFRCVTTNCTLNSRGHLVMGAGIALAAKKLYPDMPKLLGKWVREYGSEPLLCPPERIISFPTKHHWRENSDFNLIAKSASKIALLADQFKIDQIVLTRPGCGCGGLQWEDVKPLIAPFLDDRFTVLNVE
jgi:O-acetyl-ADP-ribose deacetylase (regulator of RNase III)